MPLQPVQSSLRRFLQELLVQFRPPRHERHVHQAAAPWLGGRPKQPALVEVRIQPPRPLAVLPRHRSQPPLGLNPLQHQPQDVDPERRGGVVQRILGGVCPVLQHRRQIFRPRRHQVLPNNHQRQSRRAQVLLRPGVDHAVLRNVERSAEDVAAGVAHQRDSRRGRGLGGELRPENRVVRGEVRIRRGSTVTGLRRDVAEIPVGTAADLVHPPDSLCFDHCLLRPDPRHQVVGRPPGGQQVHRHHRELQRRPPLQQQHVVVGRNARQLAAQCQRFFVHRQERLAPVRMLEDANAGRPQAQQVLPGLLEHRLGQAGGTGGKVENAAGHADSD